MGFWIVGFRFWIGESEFTFEIRDYAGSLQNPGIIPDF